MWALNVNFTPVVIAAISSMLIGWFWFSWLFEKPWLELIGKTEGEIKQGKPARAMFLAFLGKIITAYALSVTFHLLVVSDVVAGIKIAFLIWLGFVATTGLAAVIFEGKRIKLYALSASYELVSLVMMGYFLAIWT